MEGSSEVVYDELKLLELKSKGSIDFDGWIFLISKLERTYPDDIEKISLIYDTFLSKFPLCHGYWRKYAAHRARLCTVDSVIKVFERAVQLATYSVGVWVDYCHFSMSVLDDPDDVRRLFKRGLSFVKRDYLCHALWDKYIEFEFHQQQWSSLAHLYIDILRFPTKKLPYYFDCFKKFADIYKEETGCHNDCEFNEDNVISSCSDHEVALIIKDLEDSSHISYQSKALQKFLYVGERFYQDSSQLDENISPFEACIERAYFDVVPLDVAQLENWHRYLDFVEIHGDFDWAVKLFERCLIPCASYPEFWVRYVEFMEAKGGREIANFALERATQVFLKNSPVIHLFNARFKEKIRDLVGACAAFLQLNADSDSNFVDVVVKRANMERRLGNFAAASNTYKTAIEMAANKPKLQMLPHLYIHFSRLNYKITGCRDAARDVLMQGIKHVPHCKLLLEELIKFMVPHEDPRNLIVIDSIIAEEISLGLEASEGLDAIDREGLSNLYLEFVDLCGTIDDVRKAWNRHMKLFPHSLRTATPLGQQASMTLHLKFSMDKRIENSTHPSGDCSPDPSNQFRAQVQEISLPEVSGTVQETSESSRPKLGGSPDHLQPEVSGIGQERSERLSPTLTEESEGSHPKLHASSVDIVPKFPKLAGFEEASQEPNETSDNRASNQDGGDDRNTIYLECVSLNSEDSEPVETMPAKSNPEDNPTIDVMPTKSSMDEAPWNTLKSNEGASEEGNSMTNKSTSQFLVSARESVCHSPSKRIKIPTSGWSDNPSHRKNIDGVQGGSGTASQHHSNDQQHNENPGPQAEITPQMVESTGFSCVPVSSQNTPTQEGSQLQNQYQVAVDQGAAAQGKMLNASKPASESPFQAPAVSAAQPEVSQIPFQTDEMYAQSMETYNQMWSCYYYQQQLALHLQQQQARSLHFPQQLQLQPQEQHHYDQLQQLQQQQWPFYHLQIQQQQLLQWQQQQQQQQYLQSQQQLFQLQQQHVQQLMPQEPQLQHEIQQEQLLQPHVENHQQYSLHLEQGQEAHQQRMSTAPSNGSSASASTINPNAEVQSSED